MLDEDFQNVFDLDDFSLHADGERLEHWQEIGVHVRVMFWELILRWDGDLVKLVTGFTFFDSDVFLCDKVITVLSVPATSSLMQVHPFMAYVSAHKLELEITHVLLAVGVVTDDAHTCMLAQKVLALLKDDLRVADGGTHAEEASNLAPHINLEVDWGRLELWPVDVDHLRALERGDSSVNVSPIFLIVGCHLSAQTVLDAELGLLVITAEQHARWQPVRKCQNEGVGHLTGSGRSINELL